MFTPDFARAAAGKELEISKELCYNILNVYAR